MEILPYLFVSAGNIEEFDGIKISLVPGDTSSFDYHFPIYDEPGKKLIGPAVRTNTTINKHKKNQKILIYCRQGMSRSIAVCAWHLMFSGMSRENSLLFLERKGFLRSDINPDFLSEFLNYERKKKNNPMS